jgi:hypothetical protein
MPTTRTTAECHYLAAAVRCSRRLSD